MCKGPEVGGTWLEEQVAFCLGLRSSRGEAKQFWAKESAVAPFCPLGQVEPAHLLPQLPS